MRVAHGVFTADNTNILAHLVNLVILVLEANNYVTLFLDTLDPTVPLGVISYSLQPFNDDGSTSKLPGWIRTRHNHWGNSRTFQALQARQKNSNSQ